MAKKSQQAFAQYNLICDFLGENLCCANTVSNNFNELKQLYSDYKKSLLEIDSMIEYNLYINNSEETAYWRRFMMRTKMEMREIYLALN